MRLRIWLLAIGLAGPFQAVAAAAASPSPNAAMAALERGTGSGGDTGGDPLASGSLAERMQRARVPGISIAVIDHCQVAWAKGYGVQQAGGASPVTTQTLFQAASLSKTLTAVAVLRQVQARTLALDAPVNAQLQRWHLPGANGVDPDLVTVRMLLSHTAGTSVEGFDGYAEGEAVPSLRQVLEGVAPANSAPVRAEMPAMAQIRYSGGGFAVLQQLLEETTGRPFSAVLEDAVLRPARMTHSSFLAPSRDAGGVASGHDQNGAPLPGRWRTYPELAAAGLWTTAPDLARFAISVARSYQGHRGQLLAPALARDALRPQSAFPKPFGLGFRYAASDSGETLFFHTGANAGYRAIYAMNAPRCQGVVVMTNSDSGTGLELSILRDIARLYHWPFIRTLVG